MKTQLQQALANTQTVPPVPPVAAAPTATLAQRIAACVDLTALLQLEAEARVSPEQGIWLVYLDAVATLHAAVTAAKVQAAATKAAADAAAAQAVADALLQSTILKIVEKFAPAIAAMPALLAQIQPALDAYRASRAGNASVSVASIINAVANAPMPVVQSQAAPTPAATPRKQPIGKYSW